MIFLGEIEKFTGDNKKTCSQIWALSNVGIARWSFNTARMEQHSSLQHVEDENINSCIKPPLPLSFKTHDTIPG